MRSNPQRNEHLKDSYFLQLFVHVAVVAAVVFISATSAFAQEYNNVRAVRLSDVEGTVQLLDNNGVVFDQAHPNMPVTEGMHLKTGDNGRVEVQFEDGSVARVTPNSSIRFDQLQRTSDGNTVTRIEAVSGLSYYEINNRGGSYSVHFGPYAATATKSSIFRIALDQNPAQLAVMRGDVHVETGNAEGQDIKTNQTATLDVKDDSSYDVADKFTADSWDQWNSDRDSYLAKLASNATMARTVSGSPDDPAWSDLDYYGNWYSMPGYGMGWMPTGVGAGWDPFGSGYWGYYPAYGYTWISSNPWGWYPYHCGAWNWFNGPGWMWFPGNCGWGAFGRGWYPVTSVWNVPPNYTPPTRPGKVSPVRGPVHMPPQQALISVSRGTPLAPIRKGDDPKPVMTPIRFEGKTIQPVERTVVPRTAGPLGESFRVSSGFVSPTQSGARLGTVVGTQAPLPSGNLGGGGREGYLSSPSAPRSTIAPRIGDGPSAPPAPRFSAPPPPPPSFHATPSSGGESFSGGGSHYSAPSSSSAPHMSAPSAPSAPASSGGGAHR